MANNLRPIETKARCITASLEHDEYICKLGKELGGLTYSGTLRIIIAQYIKNNTTKDDLEKIINE